MLNEIIGELIQMDAAGLIDAAREAAREAAALKTEIDQRKAALFALWEEVAEDGDDELVAVDVHVVGAERARRYSSTTISVSSSTKSSSRFHGMLATSPPDTTTSRTWGVRCR